MGRNTQVGDHDDWLVHCLWSGGDVQDTVMKCVMAMNQGPEVVMSVFKVTIKCRKLNIQYYLIGSLKKETLVLQFWSVTHLFKITVS